MIRTANLSLTALLFFACAGPTAATRDNGASAAAATPAPTLTPKEREDAVANLEATRKAFLASLQGLSDAQFHFKPAPDRWSVAEVAEHIALSEDRMFTNVTERIMHSPADPKLLAEVRRDNDWLHMVEDRSHKIKAPEILRPTGRFPTVESVTVAFTQSRDKSIAYIQVTQDELHGHVGPHPVLKVLDGYQWLLLMSAHSARHVAQMAEVKADPNFPKS
jgi:hypothetical protein